MPKITTLPVKHRIDPEINNYGFANMKHIGKWIFILSTIFCSFVVIFAMPNPTGPEGDVPIGAGAGIFFVFFFWCGTALPGLYIYWNNRRKEKKSIAVEGQTEQELVEKQYSQENKAVGGYAKGFMNALALILSVIILGLVGVIIWGLIPN